MPSNRSNKDLVDEARALGAQLGLEVDAQASMGNQKLTALVDELRKTVEEKGPQAGSAPAAKPPAAEPAPTVSAPEPEREVPPPLNGAGDDDMGGEPIVDVIATPLPASPFAYSIAPGRSLVCARGHLVPGDEVRVSDFTDGEARLDQLIGEGFIIVKR